MESTLFFLLLSLIYDSTFLRRRKPRNGDDDYDDLFVVDITERDDVMGTPYLYH
jgi:hypothetical protein